MLHNFQNFKTNMFSKLKLHEWKVEIYKSEIYFYEIRIRDHAALTISKSIHVNSDFQLKLFYYEVSIDNYSEIIFHRFKSIWINFRNETSQKIHLM